MYIKRFISLMMVVVLFTLCACGKTETSTEVPALTGDFEFTVLKVGKADAMILRTENHCVVIDCGEEDDGDEVVEYLNDNGITKVDCMFVTHFDKDHVGGVPEVIKNTEIDLIITPDYEGSNDEYANYVKTVSENNIDTLKLKEYMSFALDDVLFEVYPPQKDSYIEEDNDFSLAIAVTHGDNSFLFAGDAEEVRMKEIISQTNKEYDFLKFPHHGMYNEGVKEFAESINPAYCIITCSDKNPAEEQTVSILESLGCNIYYTRNGNVNVKSDGNKIKAEQ